MTTVAWDGTTLAADRAAWSGNSCYRVRKVFRVETRDRGLVLVGVCGDGGFAMALMDWMRGKGEKPGDYPDDSKKSLAIALVIDSKRRAWKLDSRLFYTRVYGRCVASGAGHDAAMGAMLAGADARRAVLITAKCTDVSALGVDTVRF